MACSFVVYIDESGDEGFKFGAGSSEWFVLSAVVTRKVTDVQTVKLVDGVREALGKPMKKPLHFRDLKHEQCLPYIDRIARADLRTVSVLVRKPSLLERETFSGRYRLYFHATRYLLERVSWYCRDHHVAADLGDGSVEIHFSNRSGMSYAELGAYLDYLKENSGLFEVGVHWPAIRTDQIFTASPGRLMGLQIADAVAGAFWRAVEKSRHGFTEPRYAVMLKPVVYAHERSQLGYGIKFWPKEAVTEVVQADEERFEWLRQNYL